MIIRNELDNIAIKEKRLNECLDRIKEVVVPLEVKIKINNIIVQELENLKFYEQELKLEIIGKRCVENV